MSIFDALDISASGLTAERLRMDVTAENLANAQTTEGADGQPYRRKEVVLQEAGGAGGFGAALAGAMGGRQPARARRRPGRRHHRGRRRRGKLRLRPRPPGRRRRRATCTMPNVDPVTEMVDLISASRAYEANVTAMQTAKQMFTKTLDLLR